MEEYVDVMFSNSPTFKLLADADKSGLEEPGWFDSKTPLRSGWAWGQQYLDGGVAMYRRQGRQGPAGNVRTIDPVPRSAAWDVQAPLQRHHASRCRLVLCHTWCDELESRL